MQKMTYRKKAATATAPRLKEAVRPEAELAYTDGGEEALGAVTLWEYEMTPVGTEGAEVAGVTVMVE